MFKRSTIVTIVVFLLVLILGINSMFIVEEGEQAITVRLGEIKNTYTRAGINFKVPVVDQVKKFPKKTLSWNNKPKDIITNDKEYLQVNVTARWRIVDPVKFYETNFDINQSYSKLDTILDPQIKTVIAANNRVEVVRSDNEMLDDDFETSESTKIKNGRAKISQQIKDGVESSFANQGIEIIDIIFKKVRFSDNLTQSVYERMIKSRNVIAESYRSEGRGAREKIIGETDKEILEIRSKAEKYAQEVRGKADAAAAKIYADAYKGESAEFYAFWRALESYKQTMPKYKKTFSTDMEYFQYLYSSEN